MLETNPEEAALEKPDTVRAMKDETVRIRVPFDFSKGILKLVDIMAARKSVTRGEIIRLALREYWHNEFHTSATDVKTQS